MRGALPALLLGAAAALALLVPTERSAEAPPRARAGVAVAPVRPLPAGHAAKTVSCRSELALPAEEEGRRLRAAVSELDRAGTSTTDLQDLGATLERLLRQRPELAPAAVSALEETGDRRVLFQVARALRGVASWPSVHAELLSVLDREARDELQEAVVQALQHRDDPEALRRFAALLASPRAGVLARSAAAYALASEVERLAPADRALAVSQARALVAAPETPERLRVESFGLLGRAGLDPPDRRAAHEAVSSSSDEVALAAAKALLLAGEDRVQVARSLRARAQGDPALTAQLDLLEGKAP